MRDMPLTKLLLIVLVLGACTPSFPAQTQTPATAPLTPAASPTTTVAPTTQVPTIAATVAPPTQTPTAPVTATPPGPCEIVAESEVTVYNRPSPAAAVFGTLSSGVRVRVAGKTADGWWGFDPGVAQAANVGVFRLRWVEISSVLRAEGACDAVPEVVGPPPGVCFTMPMDQTPVYVEANTTSRVLATLSPSDYAAVVSSTTGDWVRVDLSTGNTGLALSGWVQRATLNLNGPCSGLPVLLPTATIAPTAPATPTMTPVPPPTPPDTPTPAPTPLSCAVLPMGGFLTVWSSDPNLQATLGCPTSNHPRVVPEAWSVETAYQTFERGAMIWSDHIGWYEQQVIYVLYADGTYQRFQDTYDPATDPVSGGETPPDGLAEPILGFGKLWREQPGVREALGWATVNELPGDGRFQMFLGGDMVWISQTNRTYIFIFVSGAVYVYDVPF